MNSSVRSSVNAKTIAYFNTLSSQWWEITTLQQLNNTMVHILQADLANNRRSDVGKPLNNLLAIDIGCGGGIMSEALARLGGTIMGIDPAVNLIKVAEKHAKLDLGLTNLTYKMESVEEHALNNSATYDIALATSVLCHVHDKETFLENCVKCIKPGGTFWVSMFNTGWTSWFMAKFFESKWKDVPRGVFDCELFMSPQALMVMLAKYDCKTVSVSGLPFNIIRNGWECNKNVSLMYLLKCVKC